VLRDEPEQGDVFLLYGPARRTYVRAGIVVDVVDVIRHSALQRSYDCMTIEGDTDQAMSLRGGMLLWRRRRLSAARNDAFVRWTELPYRRVPVKSLDEVGVVLRDGSADAPLDLRTNESEAA
jgi:hypothetical protein